MKWRVAIVALTLAPTALGAWACSTDTFVGDDGGGADALTVTTNDFCDAEAHYYARCDPSTCNQNNLASCGTWFYGLNPLYAQAFVDCESQSAITCKATVSQLQQSPCLLNAIDGKLGTPAMTKLAQDFCSHCAPDVGSCVTNFANLNPPGPGSIASLFDNTIVQAIDSQCTSQLVADAGGDGGLSCVNAFLACELAVIASHVPPDACRDAAAD
jgi:hypothetical protein